MIRFKKFVEDAWEICEDDTVVATLYSTSELVREDGRLQRCTRWFLVPIETLERCELDCEGSHLFRDGKVAAITQLTSKAQK